MKQHTPGSAMARYGCRRSGRCAGLGFTKNRNLRAAPGADAGGAARRAERFRFPTPGGGVARPDLTDQVLGSDLKAAARESEFGKQATFREQVRRTAALSVPGWT